MREIRVVDITGMPPLHGRPNSNQPTLYAAASEIDFTLGLCST